jgi:hypothetical protein
MPVNLVGTVFNDTFSHFQFLTFYCQLNKLRWQRRRKKKKDSNMRNMSNRNGRKFKNIILGGNRALALLDMYVDVDTAFLPVPILITSKGPGGRETTPRNVWCYCTKRASSTNQPCTTTACVPTTVVTTTTVARTQLLALILCHASITNFHQPIFSPTTTCTI